MTDEFNSSLTDEEVNKYINEYFETIAQEDGSILVRPKWISVKDRLPKIEGYYLCFWKNIHTRETFLAQGYFHSKIQFAPARTDAPITHWMPLPEPPKE